MNIIKQAYKHLTPKERKIIILFTFIALASLFSLFLIFLKNSTKEVPKNGGEIKIGFVGQPTNINPVLIQNEIDNYLVRLLFSDLNTLSSNIEPEENGKVWRVRLKENIFWSDNKKITSDDVIFTLEKIKESQNNLAFYSFWKNILIQRSSELEVKFILDKPYSFFPEILNNFFVIPKHIFADIPIQNWRLSEYNLKPISNGPYILDKINIEKNGFISFALLKTNSYYPNQKPFISRIILQFYPNSQELLKNFNLGKVDVFPENNIKNLENIKRPYNFYNFLLSSYYAIFINQTQNLALKEINVRKAMSLAINKNEIVESIFKNNYLPISNPLPWFNLEPKDEYNPELANKILNDNGWELNSLGIREKKIGKDTIQLKFEMIVPDIESLKKTAQKIKNYWSQIGIETEINFIDPQSLALNNLKNRNYELILFGNTIYPPLDLYPFWYSGFIFWPGGNLALYNNSSADKLMEAIHKDANKKDLNQNLQNLLQIIHDDYPAIFLYSPSYFLITTKNIYGIEKFLISNQNELFKNIYQWYTKTKRVFK
jgi:peptide/nickel transport system substrate-binding protein